MAEVVDITDEFVAALSAHHGVPKDGQLLLPQNAGERHEFTKVAQELSARIADMRTFVHKCQRKYSDYSLRGMKDPERDEIDSEVAQFLRSAMSQIDVLKKDAVAELEQDKGSSFAAHKLGVVVILNEDLQAVSKLSEGLRGVRIKQAVAEKAKAKVQYNADVARELAEERRRSDAAVGDAGEEDFALLEQEFARENATLVNELVETRERVREAERTVFEIANLNHVFATKVLEQAREIETLYDLAVEATQYVDRGNRELRKMRQRGPIMKYGLALLALLLAFALLFLEWMSRRRSLFFL